MKNALLLLVLSPSLVAGVACRKAVESDAVASPTTQAPAGTQPASKPAPILKPILGTETSPPPRVKVAHVLIAFAGAERSRATRTKDQAAQLAAEIYEKAKAGAKFDDLMRQSDDPGGGKYGMFMDPKSQKPGDFPRSGMAGAFGDIGFTLKVGEIGVAPFDPQKSPFGWHVIQRIE